VTGGFEIVLDGGVEAGRDARRAIALNDPTLPQPVQEDVWLLVTELVTNGIRHGGAAADRPLRLAFQRQAGRVRVEVVDPGTDFDPPPEPSPGDDSGGWGLFLVDRIAESWGVSPAPTGTCVWFEMPSGAAH
jgi:anti-sigma regulatory factor (Ser/Thr protein kinase)